MRIDGKDAFINRLGRWNDPVAVAKAHAISAQIWSDYQQGSFDRSLKGAGKYPYPRMLFFHENSHQGTGQYHTHLITEKMPTSLNTQYEMENLFRKRLPHKFKALSRWKSIDIQRINPQDDDYIRISSYLGKQTNLQLIALDPFNSDLSLQSK